MLFYRMYDSDSFDKYHRGVGTGDYENLITKCFRYENIPVLRGVYINSIKKYDLYSENLYNECNYLTNKLLFRNTDNNENVDKDFRTSWEIYSDWEIEILEKLFSEIDNYDAEN